MKQMAFCDLTHTFHKQVTNVSQHVFVILLWGILMSPLTALLQGDSEEAKIDYRSPRPLLLPSSYPTTHTPPLCFKFSLPPILHVIDHHAGTADIHNLAGIETAYWARGGPVCIIGLVSGMGLVGSDPLNAPSSRPTIHLPLIYHPQQTKRGGNPRRKVVGKWYWKLAHKSFFII